MYLTAMTLESQNVFNSYDTLNQAIHPKVVGPLFSFRGVVGGSSGFWWDWVWDLLDLGPGTKAPRSGALICLPCWWCG